MIELKWAGVDTSNGRIWGYLIDKNEESMFQSYNMVKVFWGSKGGSLRFQGTRSDAVFWKNARKKQKKYHVWDTTLNDRVKNEYEQVLILRKLRNGY